jgi:hypothetical protein
MQNLWGRNEDAVNLSGDSIQGDGQRQDLTGETQSSQGFPCKLRL